MRSKPILILALVAVFGLGGCSTIRKITGTEGLGDMATGAAKSMAGPKCREAGHTKDAASILLGVDILKGAAATCSDELKAGMAETPAE